MSTPAESRAPPEEVVDVFVSASEDEGEVAPGSTPEVTPELLSALVKQVEFYFSDANLPTDKKLLKQIRKDSDGFVPVKLFANFRKVRALSKDVAVIAQALTNTTQLQLSEDGKRVRRVVPVPDYDITDIQRRTVVVENLPGNPSPTIESVTDMFKLYGRVKLVRICSRESKGKLPSWLTSSCQNMNGQHAYVEFEDEEGAILASAALALEYDGLDGCVQVRRLLTCIAEQRERRSGSIGNASSFGGSSGAHSRKGSRDSSPAGRNSSLGGSLVHSRRNSHGGVSAAGSWASGSMGGSSYGLASYGGAPPEHLYGMPYSGHHHHSYGGAGYEPAGGSMGGAPPPPPPPARFSAGGIPIPGHPIRSALLAPGGVPPPPPPPPPPRRISDSAVAADVHAAGSMPSIPPPPPPPPASLPRLNVYRPPAKRLSDTNMPVGTAGAAPVAGLRVGSSSSMCTPSLSLASSAMSSAHGSTVSTPTAASAAAAPVSALFAPSPPPAKHAPSSPPLAARSAAVSAGGSGKPPVHPPVALPVKLVQEQPQQNPVAPAPNALAEAIAQTVAERRETCAGLKAAAAAAAAAMQGSPRGSPQAPAAPAHSRPAASAPKFMLDLVVPPTATVPSSAGSSAVTSPSSCSVASSAAVAAEAPVRRTAVSIPSAASRAAAGAINPAPRQAPKMLHNTIPVPGVSSRSGGAPPAPRPAPAPAPAHPAAPVRHGGQMVEDVEGFIASILAKPTQRQQQVQAQQPKQEAAEAPAAAAAKGSTRRPADAATAVAGILAATLIKRAAAERQTEATRGPRTKQAQQQQPASGVPAEPANPTPEPPAGAPEPAATPAPAPATVPTSRPMVHITAIAMGDAEGDGDDGEHAALALTALQACRKGGSPRKYVAPTSGGKVLPAASHAIAISPVASSASSPRDGVVVVTAFMGRTPASASAGHLSRTNSAGSPGQMEAAAGGAASLNLAHPWHVARGPDGSRGFGLRASKTQVV